MQGASGGLAEGSTMLSCVQMSVQLEESSGEGSLSGRAPTGRVLKVLLQCTCFKLVCWKICAVFKNYNLPLP